jgi:hypothetical protein
MKIDEKKLRKIIEKHSIETYMELIRWLYDNYIDILREWEATQGNLRIEFAGEKNGI